MSVILVYASHSCYIIAIICGTLTSAYSLDIKTKITSVLSVTFIVLSYTFLNCYKRQLEDNYKAEITRINTTQV